MQCVPQVQRGCLTGNGFTDGLFGGLLSVGHPGGQGNLQVGLNGSHCSGLVSSTASPLHNGPDLTVCLLHHGTLLGVSQLVAKQSMRGNSMSTKKPQYV